MTGKIKFQPFSNKKGQLRIADPDEITNLHLQYIGRQYLKKKRSGFANFFHHRSHKDSNSATVLAEYNHDNETYRKWLYLATTYENLRSHHGLLAKSILELFQSVFTPYHSFFTLLKTLSSGDEMNAFGYTSPKLVADSLRIMIQSHYFKMEFSSGDLTTQPHLHLTPAMDDIHSIGETYLRKHPTSSKRHNNQTIATKMAEHKQPSSHYDNWLFLADCFGELANHDELAANIFLRFERAFGNCLNSSGYRFIASPYIGIFTSKYFNNQDIALFLKDLVNSHLAEQHLQLIDNRKTQSLSLIAG